MNNVGRFFLIIMVFSSMQNVLVAGSHFVESFGGSFAGSTLANTFNNISQNSKSSNSGESLNGVIDSLRYEVERLKREMRDLKDSHDAGSSAKLKKRISLLEEKEKEREESESLELVWRELKVLRLKIAEKSSLDTEDIRQRLDIVEKKVESLQKTDLVKKDQNDNFSKKLDYDQPEDVLSNL